MENLAPMLVFITFTLVGGSVLRAAIVNRRLREATRAQADLQTKLIERFATAEEAVRYLEGAAGRSLLQAPAEKGGPHARILDSIHVGLLVLMGGAGLLAARRVADAQAAEVIQVLGTIAVVLGAGFLASAGLSWLLLRKWGLLDGGRRAAEGE